MRDSLLTNDFFLGLAWGTTFGIVCAIQLSVCEPAPALRLPVATAAQAMALSREDQLGRYFDCLEWVVEERVLQTCEDPK